MSKPRILIVEDDPIIALDLEVIVADRIQAEVVVVASIAEARHEIAEPVNLALLDIDVVDGKTFALAETLRANRTPIVFVSGSKPHEIPPSLRDVGFIAKPFRPERIEQTVAAVLKAG